MKKMIVLILLILLLISCGAEKKAEELVEKVDELTEEMKEVIGQTSPGTKDESKEESSSEAEWSNFNGYKGEIVVNQELERYGIKIKLDKVIFDDDPGLFNPPAEGMIFFYPILTITNHVETNTQLSFSTQGSCLPTVDGTLYKRTMAPLYSYGGKEKSLDTNLDVGKTDTRMTGFEIPKDWKQILINVNQDFDGHTKRVKMVFELKRDSGDSKSVQLVDAAFEKELPTAPRLSAENYLTKEEAEEVSGLFVIAETETMNEDYLSAATYILHADKDADPENAPERKRIKFYVKYPKDALLEYEMSWAPEKEYSSTKKGEYFSEEVPNLGEDAFYYQHPADKLKTLYILTKNDYGHYMIVIDLEGQGEESWLIPLGQKILDFLKDPKERVTAN